MAADLAGLLIEHGHSQVDFTVVGSGPNGANPHHEAGDRTIQDGDMIVLDFGGLKDGDGSDTSRTIHVGEPSEEEREVHDIVRQAQQAGYEAVRPGVECQEIDRAPRHVISDAGYGENFIHRTGHGIGLTTHEPPYMVEGETHALEPGMCFSIEPGIYLSGALRRPHRGHRRRDRGRRPAPQQHHARDADRRLTRAPVNVAGAPRAAARVEALGKRRTAAERSGYLGSPLAERSERQTAVDRSRCSGLTSRRSPVRARHRPSPRVPSEADRLPGPGLTDMSRIVLWKRRGSAEGHNGRPAALLAVDGIPARPTSPTTSVYPSPEGLSVERDAR